MNDVNGAYWKIRYESLKARGRCVVCGKAFKERGLKCEDCKIKASAASHRWQKKRMGGITGRGYSSSGGSGEIDGVGERRRCGLNADKDIFAKAARLESENKRLQEENARLNNTLDASIENTERSIRQTDEAMRRWLEACAELEPLRNVALALARIARAVEEHYHDGCLFCGYKVHRSYCSLNEALTEYRALANPLAAKIAKSLTNLDSRAAAVEGVWREGGEAEC